MKKIISLFLSLALVLSIFVPAFSVSALAHGEGGGGWNTEPIDIDIGEVTPKPVEYTVTEEDGADRIDDLLYEARDNASEGTPYIINVEPGVYILQRAFHIFSNTSIVADLNTFFVMTGDGEGDNMLKVGDIRDDSMSGYGYKNITVSGGDWNMNGKVKTMFKICHAENCKIENVNAHNIKDAHFVEIAAVDGFSLLNSNFYDMNVTVSDGREAVQIDVLHPDHIQGYEHLSDEIDYLCKNITIDGCTFNGVRRAVGSHTVVQGKYYDNVKITNNQFINTEEKSILCYNLKNLTISGNDIYGNDVGIELKTMDKNGAGTYLSETNKESGTAANIEPLNAEIFDNTVFSKNNHAILVNGVILSNDIPAKNKTNDKVLAGNYFVEGVNIHDNTLTAKDKSCAIKVQYAKNVVVDKNTVTADTTSETPVYVTDGSSKISVTNNTVNSTVLNGIRVCNLLPGYPKGNITAISGNTVANVKSGGYGIRISDAAVTAVEKNTITKSANIGIQADKNANTGLAVSITKINSNVIKSSKIAIKVMNATVGEIVSNKISPTSAHSVQIENSKITKIDKNTISTSGQTAIILSKSKVTEVNSNTITGPKQMGIYCYNSSTCDKISGNKISGAKTNGIVVNTAVIKSIDSNTISSCKSFGIYLNGNNKTQVNSIKGNKISSCLLGIKILKGPKANVYVNSLSKNKGGNKYVVNGKKQYSLANISSVSPTAKKSGSTIKITWKKKSAVSGYLIYRSTKSKSAFSKLSSVGAKATSFVDKKTKAKTTYYYRVLPYYKVPGSNVVMYANYTQTKGAKR